MLTNTCMQEFGPLYSRCGTFPSVWKFLCPFPGLLAPIHNPVLISVSFASHLKCLTNPHPYLRKRESMQIPTSGTGKQKLPYFSGGHRDGATQGFGSSVLILVIHVSLLLDYRSILGWRLPAAL